MAICHILRITATLLLAIIAYADVVVGASLSITGPSVSLGITQKNSLMLYPDAIGGEKLRLVVVDDASDPSTGTRLARRLVAKDRVDIIVDSPTVAPSIAITEVAIESYTPQLTLVPVELKPGKGGWTYRLMQSISLMAKTIITRTATSGIRNVGFISFADAHGESWLKDLTAAVTSRGIKIVNVERYARADTNVTRQVAKLISIRPDAVLVTGAGTGTVLPHTMSCDRGHVESICRVHGAATKDLIRVDGKAIDGAILPADPMIAAEQSSDSHPSRKTALEYVTRYEKANGPDTHTQFGVHTWDALQVLQRIVLAVLKKAKSGILELRQTLKNALESEYDIVVSCGVLNYTATDHFGLDVHGRMLLIIDRGKWKLLN